MTFENKKKKLILPTVIIIVLTILLIFTILVLNKKTNSEIFIENNETTTIHSTKLTNVEKIIIKENVEKYLDNVTNYNIIMSSDNNFLEVEIKNTITKNNLTRIIIKGFTYDRTTGKVIAYKN